jgi:hypothetical protein
MRTLQLSVIIFFIAVFSNSLYAGEADKNGTGTDAEPDCDDNSVVAYSDSDMEIS